MVDKQFLHASGITAALSSSAREATAHALRLARSSGVQVYALASGQSRSGIDLGSDSVKSLRKPAVALVMGEGVSGICNMA